MQSKINYSGYCIGRFIVRPIGIRVKFLLDFPRPTKKKHVQFLLDILN